MIDYVLHHTVPITPLVWTGSMVAIFLAGLAAGMRIGDLERQELHRALGKMRVALKVTLRQARRDSEITSVGDEIRLIE